MKEEHIFRSEGHMSDDSSMVRARRWLKIKTGLLVLSGIVFILVLFSYFSHLHEFDYRLTGWVQRLNAKSTNLSPELIIVDVPTSDLGGTKQFRASLLDLLHELSGRPDNLPKQVVLDIAFRATGYVEELANAVVQLRSKRLNIFGVCPKDINPHELCQFPIETAPLYESFSAIGHSHFSTHETAPYYRPCGPIRSVVQLMLTGADMRQACRDDNERLVSMGEALEQQYSQQLLSFDKNCANRFRHFNGECLKEATDFRGKTLLIGRLAYDRSEIYLGRSGPEVIAWAFSSQNDTAPSTALMIAITIVAAFISVISYGLLLRYFRQWRVHPWRIACVALLASLVACLFIIVPMGLFGRLNTQITLAFLVTICTLSGAVYFTRQESLINLRLRNRRIAHEYLTYDLFISYRSHYRDVVKDKLWLPLQGLRRVDGESLNVFWDSASLHRGNFHQQLEKAVMESRIFIAFLSPDYFDHQHPYCRWELESARAAGCEMVLVCSQGYDPSALYSGFEWLRDLHTYSEMDPDLSDKLRRDICAAEAGLLEQGVR